MFRTEKPWLRVYEGRASPETQIYDDSLTDFFHSWVEQHRDKPALAFCGTTFDFVRLEALSENVAASLAARGARKGAG